MFSGLRHVPQWLLCVSALAQENFVTLQKHKHTVGGISGKQAGPLVQAWRPHVWREGDPAALFHELCKEHTQGPLMTQYQLHDWVCSLEVFGPSLLRV